MTRIPRRTLLLASLTIMTLANLSAGIVLLRDKPTPLMHNSSQPIVEADFGLGDGTAPLLLPSPASVLGGDLPDPSLLDVPRDIEESVIKEVMAEYGTVQEVKRHHLISNL